MDTAQLGDMYAVAFKDREVEILYDSNDDRETWLEKRKLGVGASETPILMGLSPWGSPFELYAKKAGLLPPDSVEQDTERMQFGRRFEKDVIAIFAERTGRITFPSGVLLRSKRWPNLLATLDGWQMRERAPFEAKWIGERSGDKWADGPPEMYVVQVMQQIAVTESEFGSIGAVIGGQRFVWADVPRDERLIDEIVRVANQFSEQVRSGVGPAPDERAATLDVLKILYPQDDGSSIELPPEGLEVAADLASLKEERRKFAEIDSRIKELETLVKGWLGPATLGTLPDGSSFSLRTQTRGAYTVPEWSGRVLRFHEPKRR